MNLLEVVSLVKQLVVAIEFMVMNSTIITYRSQLTLKMTVSSGVTTTPYLGSQIILTLPTIGNITDIIEQLDIGSLIFKFDTARTFHHIKIDPLMQSFHWNTDRPVTMHFWRVGTNVYMLG